MNKTELFVLILVLAIAVIGVFVLYKGVGKAIDEVDPLDAGFAPMRIASQPGAGVPSQPYVPPAQPTTIATRPPPSYFVPPEQVPDSPAPKMDSWGCYCFNANNARVGEKFTVSVPAGSAKSVAEKACTAACTTDAKAKAGSKGGMVTGKK